ncbi:MAG: carbamoyltransferase C-terminal domain-containing protein [Nitrospira sp.]
MFEHRTGVPILLNTSFSIHEPIVCTPDEALTTFLKSDLDAVVIGNYFIAQEMVGGWEIRMERLPEAQMRI